ncbi:MAG TPA: winged helix-turn-helix domain-containing protein [Candidatus Nanoarchaeia archaeon]|nr:winged helix-turn-helix domain-containing protein [Candidatus Nanoarchaeia archaeon]
MQSAHAGRYQFGEFIADLSTGELYKNGERVAIQEKPFQFLAVLLESNGAVVTREELSQRMWPDTHVQVDQGLNAAARKVRLALGDDAANPRFIETLGSRGYRFVAPFVRTATPAAEEKQIRIAVLPYENRSELSEAASEALAAELVSELGSQADLVATPASRQTRNGALRPAADYLLRGKIEGSGRVVRLSAELCASDNERPVWAAMFEHRPEELPRLQSVIAAQIGRTLQQPNSARASAGQATEFSVYENYLRGRYFWNRRTPLALHKSVEYFNLSIHQDQNYALAHAGLADSYNLLATHGLLLPKLGYEKAKECAQHALEIQPDLPQALVPLGWAQLSLDYDWESARRNFERAIELNPTYAFAYNGHSYLLMASGAVEAGIAAMRRGRDLDPLSLPINSLLSNCYFYAHDFEAAARQAELAIELDPQFSVAHECAGLAYLNLGRKEEAIRALEKAVSFSLESPIMVAHLAYALSLTGHEVRAREIVQELSQAGERVIPPAFHIGLVYVALAEYDAAFDWFQRACEQRFHWTLLMRCDPRLDRVRADERFVELCKRFNFPNIENRCVPASRPYR